MLTILLLQSPDLEQCTTLFGPPVTAVKSLAIVSGMAAIRCCDLLLAEVVDVVELLNVYRVFPLNRLLVLEVLSLE